MRRTKIVAASASFTSRRSSRRQSCWNYGLRAATRNDSIVKKHAAAAASQKAMCVKRRRGWSARRKDCHMPAEHPSVGPLVKRLRRHRAHDDLSVSATAAHDGDAAAAAAAASGQPYAVNSRLSARLPTDVLSDLRHRRQQRPHLKCVVLATVA